MEVDVSRAKRLRRAPSEPNADEDA